MRCLPRQTIILRLQQVRRIAFQQSTDPVAEQGESGRHCLALVNRLPALHAPTSPRFMQGKKSSRSSTRGSRFPATRQPGQGQVAQSHATWTYPSAGGQKVTTRRTGFGDILVLMLWERNIVCTKKKRKKKATLLVSLSSSVLNAHVDKSCTIKPLMSKSNQVYLNTASLQG